MSQMRLTVAQGRPQWVNYISGAVYCVAFPIGHVGDTVLAEFIGYKGDFVTEAPIPVDGYVVENVAGWAEAGIADVVRTEAGHVTATLTPPGSGTAAVVLRLLVNDSLSNELYVFIGQFEEGGGGDPPPPPPP